LKTIDVNFDVLKDTTLMVIISGPSGVGKDSVLRELKKRDLPIHHVVTANTREPRADEQEGVDYYFVSKEKFEQMIANGEMLEYSTVYKDYKGVPKSEVRKAINTQKDVILRLDVQGAEKIKAIYPQSILIFLTPSNQQEWYERLGDRVSNEEKDLNTRIQTVKMELEKIDIFDYVVVNAQGELSETVDIIEKIITAEHHRTKKHALDI
jgi:guanylate kinase